MSDQFEQEEAIFDAALLLTPAEPGSFLDKSCDDVQLRERIGALLKSHDDTSGILEQPALPEPPGAASLRSSISFEKPGDKIGRYKLLQQIGEGGCGVVSQEEPVGVVGRALQ